MRGRAGTGFGRKDGGKRRRRRRRTGDTHTPDAEEREEREGRTLGKR